MSDSEQKGRNAFREPFQFQPAFPQGFQGFGLVVEHCLTIDAHDTGDLGRTFLLKKIQPQNGPALAGQFLDFLENALQQSGFDPFGLGMRLDIISQIGHFAAGLPLLGTQAKVVNSLVTDDDVQPSFDVLVGFLLKLRCFLYPLSRATALTESSDSSNRCAARSIRCRIIYACTVD
jgi:hypothetical protein